MKKTITSASIQIFCVALLFTFLSPPLSASTVYSVDRTIEFGTVTGFITTDDTLGLIDISNVTSWALTISAPNINGDVPFSISSATQDLFVSNGPAFRATPTDLFFAFTGQGSETGSFTIFQGNSAIRTPNYWCFDNGSCSNPVNTAPSEDLGFAPPPAGTDAQTIARSGLVSIASTLTPVPLPAALPLFLGALAGLGGLGFMKRRKAAVA